jgi:hypothetical protein
MFQRAIACARRFAPGNEHKPKTLSQFVLMPAHNFSQTTPDAIANHGASEAAGSDKACTPLAGILHGHHIQH